MKKGDQIINIDNMNHIINKIWSIFEEYELNLSDQQIVIRFISDNLKTKVAAIHSRQQAKSLMDAVPLGGLLKRFQKEADKEDDS